ncbi:MAG: beta-xylosidase [Sphingomonas sp.]|uniref:beta-xylosidase n=1 Tax=Sphingomonas sp. TaxID=28214 RepID=UPI001B249DEB|nr:beta-xylosidase [Sphingomonas sp.]MBO9624633.1 beta-xylosidase [Sphingomonas sp.]
MIEAAMIWNEPNNKSHWDPALDPDWTIFAETVVRAGNAIAAVNPEVKRVLGGMSPIDPHWVNRMRALGAIDAVDVVAVHGFPLDWNLWPIQAWPDKIAEIEAVVPDKEIWATEVGVGSFGAEEVQVFGVRKTAELLLNRVPRVFWYSLFDLPQEWGATTRHREAEGSSYYRHFYLGLIRADGTPKAALEDYAQVADRMGLMQWFHFEDPRLDDAVAWMKRLGVRHLRTGLSWADSFRPNAIDWFDRQMEALADFDTTVTFCFTPEHLGEGRHHTSPPRDPQQFADFCAWMVDRYAPGQGARPAVAAPEVPEGFVPEAPELSTLHLNRDERLAAERSAA